jgi:hypothetical protein
MNPLLDPELIEAERKRLPDRVFAQEYGAEFLEGSGAVFRYVRDCATGAWQDPVPGKKYFAGLDLAKVQDFSVLVIMNEAFEVVFVDRFHRLDWALQVTRIKATVERYHRAQILCDSTGAGEPIYPVTCEVWGSPDVELSSMEREGFFCYERLRTLGDPLGYAAPWFLDDGPA